MAQTTFKAMVVTEDSPDRFSRRIAEKSIHDLPPGDLLIKVLYSSLNYKDALSATGNRGVTKSYPHTPGIDAAGVVIEGGGDDFKIGDPVLVTGYDLGMNTSGGFGQLIRVPVGWAVRKPDPLTLRESMIYGTAGFTAGLSVAKIVEHGILPSHGDILVTGASGGVGSLAVSVLSRIGYSVVASTGKTGEKEFLTQCGAKAIIHRDEINDKSKRPLLKSRFAGVVDTVGGDFLATALKSIALHGAATCCGNVASPELHTTVFPFILRGVTLYGIDSANSPMEYRRKIWKKLAADWKPDHLDRLANEISPAELDRHIDLILQGKLRGRTIVRIQNP
ncbi:MAG: quinone oxidoreductase [Deltaproteobacteria bacterium RBG_13_49_15]|nr:MAG: quinone oxidoreductase [Deltaproteobacteria bacterium RBG_13_49_15]